MKGSCLCGGVTFEYSGEPDMVGYCHCTRCQKRTGGASSAQARIADATESLTIHDPEDLLRPFNAGSGFDKIFCSRCGSAMFSRDPADPDRMSIRLAAFDDEHDLRPAYRQFVSYAAAWEPIPDDGLERTPESRPR